MITNAKFLNDLAEKLINILKKHPLFQKILNQTVDIKIKERSQVLEKQLSAMKQKVEAQEQYTRRNCLVFHGIDNSPHTHTDELIKKFAWENLDVEIYDTDIDRSHRLKPKFEARNKDKVYPIIVKFTSHNIKQLVYERKKYLKGKNAFITESLTSSRLHCIRQLKTFKQSKKV